MNLWHFPFHFHLDIYAQMHICILCSVFHPFPFLSWVECNISYCAQSTTASALQFFFRLSKICFFFSLSNTRDNWFLFLWKRPSIHKIINTKNKNKKNEKLKLIIPRRIEWTYWTIKNFNLNFVQNECGGSSGLHSTFS